MTLSEVKAVLPQLEKLRFQLPNGSLVPAHFHVTEVGKVAREFVDCGGTYRREDVVNFQLWTTVDYHHRLPPARLLRIIEQVEARLGLADVPVEVEYQLDTVGKFGLEFDGKYFRLTTTQTDCLAKADCAVPQRVTQLAANCCAPGGGCC